MFSKVVYLYCDGNTINCDCNSQEAFGGDSMMETIGEYKSEMKTQGWHFRGNKAYCPSCWKIVKGEPK
jgi:hypothetical protein